MEHHFSFKRGDLEWVFKGERDFVEAQIAAFLPLMSAGAAAAPPASLEIASEPDPGPPPEARFPRVSPEFRPRRNISLLDFAALKGANAPLDLMVVAGYYLEKYMQQESYGPGELQAQLGELPAWECQSADEVLPLAVLAGYLEQLRDDRYTLTYTGQTYVRDGLG